MRTDIIIFTAADGSIIVRHPAEGHDLVSLAADAPPGTTATMATHDDLPTDAPMFRSAWRMGSDGKVSVDLAAARAVRKAALDGEKASLSASLDTLALGCMVDGNMMGLANARSAKAALNADTGASLDGVTDLADLATHEYPSITAAKALLAN